MIGIVMTYIGALLPLGWGVSHLFPTRKVVAGFGEISADNKYIISMEWVTEGVALIFIGLLIGLVTYIDRGSPISRAVYWLSFATLNTLSVVSLFTGFKHPFIAFKLCPFIFTSSSIMIIVGSYLD